MSSAVDSASVAYGLQVATTILEGASLELSAFSIFALSFLLWHYAKNGSLWHRRSPVVMKHPEIDTSSQKVARCASASESPEAESLKSRQKFKSRRPPPEVNVQEIEIQMSDFLQQKEFTRALYLFKSLEKTGADRLLKSEETISMFIVSAIRVEKYDVVEKMLWVSKRNGIELANKSWAALLKMLSMKKRFNLCLLAYSIFEEKIPVDQVVYSCLINAAIEGSLFEDAAKMLQKYKRTDLFPKEWMLFFRTYVAIGDVDQAEATFQEIDTGELTPMMLNMLLLTCVNSKEVERADRWLKRAHELEQGSAHQIVNIISYNTVIQGFKKENKLQACFDCLHNALAKGIEPDETTVGLVVDTCLKDDCVSVADALMKSFEHNITSRSTVLCTHFLTLLIKTDRMKDAADLYEDMKRREQTRPDVVTCSMMIKAYVNQLEGPHSNAEHNWKCALQVLDDMIALELKPDDLILSRLLDGCRLAWRGSACGMELFKRFVKMGVVPSGQTILTLLKLLGHAGSHSAAHELVASCWQQYGIKPLVIHYTCLMSGAVRNKNYEQAWQAYLLMCEHHVEPDATTISTLLPGLSAAQHWERVLEVVSSALRDANPPLDIPVEMVNNTLSQMVVANAPQHHILRLQDLMKGAGVPVTTRNAVHLKRHGFAD